jgi:transposase InsO family protein
MPWKGVATVLDVRVSFVGQVLKGGPLMPLCREYGISRKTAYKWLARYRLGGSSALRDRSRRPQHSPRRTPMPVEQAVLSIHDRYHWGAAKIHAHLAQTTRLALPSVTTVHAILKRNTRVHRTPPPDVPLQCFEAAQANQLWQMDFKAGLEIQRQAIYPLTILDDHSRYLLAVTACPNTQHPTAWAVLWDVMGQVGMPEAILSDNYFGNRGRLGISWFEGQLVRLGITPRHGRIYHPQTQGKVERVHGTLQRELFPYLDTSSLVAFSRDLEHWRTDVYNTLRPHEALDMQAPVSRWKPSVRARPAVVPLVEYPSDSTLRKVHPAGCISYRNCRILVGMGVAGQCVRVEERDQTVAIFYGPRQVRLVPANRLRANHLI